MGGIPGEERAGVLGASVGTHGREGKVKKGGEGDRAQSLPSVGPVGPVTLLSLAFAICCTKAGPGSRRWGTRWWLCREPVSF